MDFDLGRNVADQSDGTALSNRVDTRGNRFGAAYGFEDYVYSCAVGEFENLRREIGFGIENPGSAEIFGHF